MKRIFLSMALFCVALGGSGKAPAPYNAPMEKSGGAEIANMRCEYLVSPLGIDVEAPRFTWEYAGDETPMEIPYVEVSSDTLFSKPLRIRGNSLHTASYEAGKPLKPQKRYYWRVKIGRGKQMKVSPVAFFETGKFSSKDWKARWISDGAAKDERVAPSFSKTFRIDKTPSNARAYISASGYYDMVINGRRVGDHHMDPGFTDYGRRNLYVVHDITSYLKEGVNTVAVVLGNGFANNQLLDAWNQQNAHWRDRPKMICEIIADGKTVAATDSNWQTSPSNVVYNNIYSGEYVDARVCCQETRNAIEVRSAAPILRSQSFPAIRPVETMQADLLRSFGDTLFIFDMGKNIAGVCSMRLKGERGTMVRVRHGELLKSNGRVELGNINIYHHPADPTEETQTDLYLLSGDQEGDLFQPRFTYHGFRYAEVIANAPVKVEEVRGIMMRTAVERVGHFRCSDSLLNRIYDATMLSYEDNLHSIPTDCPQREKNGWTADSHVAIDLGLLNYDGITVYEKWMRDFIDAQKESGNIPGIVPSADWGYGDSPGPVWDAALFIIPVALYEYYGDANCIRELYPTMKRYFNWARSLKDADGVLSCGIGDWLPAHTQTPTAFTSTLYYFADNKLMARIAGLMGDDPAPYLEEMERTRDVINSRFFDKKKALYAGGTQAAQGIALYWDVVPEEYRQRVADNLNDMVVDNDYGVDFGLLGSKSVLRMLTKYGHFDTAYRMATRKDAYSWGYWIEKCGLTTLPETWVMNPEFRDASLNHVFFGDIAAWMTNEIAGLRPDLREPGCGNVVIRPHLADGLDWAEADYASVKGTVSVRWRRTGADSAILKVKLPAGVSATLFNNDGSEILFHRSFDVTIGSNGSIR